MLLSRQLFFARTMLTNMPKGQRAHRVSACAAKPQQTGLQALLTRWAAAAAQQQQQQHPSSNNFSATAATRAGVTTTTTEAAEQASLLSSSALPSTHLHPLFFLFPLPLLLLLSSVVCCALVQRRLLQFLVQLILSEVSHCCRAKPQFCVACGESGECVQWRPLLSPAVQLKHSLLSLSLSLFMCVCVVCVCVPQEVKSIAAA